MARRTKAEIEAARMDVEQHWFDLFAKWAPEDRKAAMRALGAIDRTLESVRCQQPNAPFQPKLPEAQS